MSDALPPEAAELGRIDIDSQGSGSTLCDVPASAPAEFGVVIRWAADGTPLLTGQVRAD